MQDKGPLAALPHLHGSWAWAESCAVLLHSNTPHNWGWWKTLFQNSVLTEICNFSSSFLSLQEACGCQQFSETLTNLVLKYFGWKPRVGVWVDFFFFLVLCMCVCMWAHIFNFSVEPKFSSEDYSENKKNKFFFKFSTQAQPCFLNQLLH